MLGAVLGSVAAGAVSGMLGAKGAKDAANIQAKAAQEATAEQRRQYDIARTDSAPWRDAGSDAITRMRTLLGLGGGSTARSLEDIAAQLRSGGQFSKQGGRMQGTPTGIDWGVEGGRMGYSYEDGTTGFEPFKQGGAAVDEAALNAEAQRLFAAQQTASQDPSFGSLNKRFSIADFEADPVNQLGLKFGLDEGNKAIRRMLGASGMSRSGSAVKALTRFNSDYAGSKAGESRNRFLQDQDVTFNRLAGVSGVGQTSTAQTAQLGANMANNVGQNIIGAGNARGAAAIAGSNAMGAPLAQVGSTLQTKYLLDSMRPTPTAPAPRFNYDQYANNDWAVG